jgi:hypothetical protein
MMKEFITSLIGIQFFALLCCAFGFNTKGKPIICRWNENELNRLDERERNVASALLKTVLSVLGGSLHKPLSLTDNYFYVGGNSLNAVSVVTKLRDQGFYLGIIHNKIKLI